MASSSAASARELAVPLQSEGRAPLQLREGAGLAEEDPPSLRRGPTEQFNYVAPEVKELPPFARFIRTHLFRIFLLLTIGGTVVILVIAYLCNPDHDTSLLGIPCSTAWRNLVKYLSIPVVSIGFTWWHVWLGIQMVFYPVEFVGCCKPVLGWQGIVPRRANTMAERCCDLMIGRLLTIEEIIDRITPEDFFQSLHTVLGETSAKVLARLAAKHFPDLWVKLPEYVKTELQNKTLEECQEMFGPVVEDLKTNIHNIIDIKQMAIDVLVDNKALLVKIFKEIGNKEYVFIQHVAAVMGFVLGVIQMFLWLLLNGGSELDCSVQANSGNFRCWGGYVILPVSGLLIGYFTNWLGITMIFRPVEPHIICGGYINIQGMFLKRQAQVSKEMSTLVCKHLITAQKMLEYVLRRPETVDSVLMVFQRHVHSAVDTVINKTLGPAKVVAPIFIGQGAIEGIKEEVVKETLAELPNHSQEIETYMDRAFGLRDTLSYRLARLAPSSFEGMLHPVFQEDEWMVLLLGGVLGVVVGSLQAAALKE